MAIKDDVSAQSIAYVRMAERWKLIQDLLGGTPRMREAGEDWLPKEDRERDLSYERRLSRSILYGAFKDTTEKIVSKPFSSPITYQNEEGLDIQVEPLIDDADLQGTSLTEFFKSVMRTAVRYGLAHVLVEYPKVARDINLAVQSEKEIRPYFVQVLPENLIGWVTDVDINGSEFLTEIRIQEERIELVGDYREESVKYIRVYTRENWSLYKEVDSESVDAQGNKEKTWVLVDQQEHTFGRVPLATFYIDKTGFMTASPPLEDLAYLNLAHWQSDSDQRNILRFARVGILFIKGVSDEESEKETVIGPSQVIKTTNTDADAKYVEHSGAAIGSGAEDLKTLENRMEIMGLTPFLHKTSNTTATSQNQNEASSHADIFSWIRTLESVILECFSMAAEWVSKELPEDFKVDIFDDFTIGTSAADDIRILKDLKTAGIITHATCLEEIKRRGLLSENLDVEEEIQGSKDEAPDPMLGLPIPGEARLHPGVKKPIPAEASKFRPKPTPAK